MTQSLGPLVEGLMRLARARNGRVRLKLNEAERFYRPPSNARLLLLAPGSSKVQSNVCLLSYVVERPGGMRVPNQFLGRLAQVLAA